MTEPTLSLDGLVAVVTGAGGGIGAGTVVVLAARGARVMAVDVDGPSAERAADAVTAAGGTAIAHVADVADEEAVAGVVGRALEEFGRVDVVHNNAAATRLAPRDGLVHELSLEVWNATLAANLTSVMLMTKHVVPVLRAQGGGSIVNTSSGVAHGGQHRQSAYATSKAAVEMLTRQIATQYGADNIRCNAVSPGVILHDGNRDLMPGPHLAVYERHTLLPRLGGPVDIAEIVAFLASQAGSFITGQVITVDGGLHTAVTFDVDLCDVEGGS